jgi:hypothetical protein
MTESEAQVDIYVGSSTVVHPLNQNCVDIGCVPKDNNVGVATNRSRGTLCTACLNNGTNARDGVVPVGDGARRKGDLELASVGSVRDVETDARESLDKHNATRRVDRALGVVHEVALVNGVVEVDECRDRRVVREDLGRS